jgi:hypothetical protein
MTEEELLEQISYVESSISIARKKIAETKRILDDGESELIELKIMRDKLVEQLTKLRESTPKTEPYEVWEIDIE